MTDKCAKVIKLADDQVQNGSLYCWGCDGQKIRDQTVDFLYKKETDKNNIGRVLSLMSLRASTGKLKEDARYFDCSGLIHYLWEVCGVLAGDRTADGFYKLKDGKKIKMENIKAGDLVFKVDTTGKATHVGICVDSQQTIIEAYGRDRGVIRARLGTGSQFTEARRYKTLYAD